MVDLLNKLPAVINIGPLGDFLLHCDVKVFPKSEALESIHLFHQAMGAHSCILGFKKALELYEYSVAHQPDWKRIAGREALWNIYDLAKTIEFFQKRLYLCPTLKANIDTGIIREAARLHRQNFPNFEDIRNAFAHTHEMNSLTAEFEKNAHKGAFKSDGMIVPEGETSVLVTGSFDGNVFQIITKGKIMKFEISSATLNVLIEIKNKFFSGFNGLANAPTSSDYI